MLTEFHLKNNSLFFYQKCTQKGRFLFKNQLQVYAPNPIISFIVTILQSTTCY